jgi:hypothetical protein
VIVVAGALAVLGVALTAAAGAATGRGPTAHPLLGVKSCTNGVPDRIKGRPVCIRVGGRCLAAHNSRYRARGYTCVNGRLRRIPKPTISIGDAAAAEGNSGTTTLSVPVKLSAASGSAVTVGYATANGTASAGTDYTAASGTLVFRAGETEKTIPIALAGDTSIEQDETFTVELSTPVNAKIAKASATATIRNDDTAVPVTPGSYKGATQNGNYVFFTLTPDRTITGFRVNDLPETCDPGGGITGGIDFGGDVFRIGADGSVLAEGSWTGSDVRGDVEWTSFYAKVTGVFAAPTSISGTIIEKDELNYQGQHFKCSSGDITWSATRQG